MNMSMEESKYFQELLEKILSAYDEFLTVNDNATLYNAIDVLKEYRITEE